MLTLTIEYDTYMGTTMTFKELSRTQSQGKINVSKKNFDAKTLLLPEIDRKKRKQGFKSTLFGGKLPQIGYR